MRIQIQHADAIAEMRDVEDEEEAQQLADSGLTILVAGRDGGFRQLDRRAPCDAAEEPKAAEPAAKTAKKAVEKMALAKKTVKKK